MNNQKLKKFLISSILPLSIFQDTGLQNSPFSIALGSPVFLVLSALLLINLKEIELKVSARTTCLFLVATFINVFYLFFYSSEYSAGSLIIKSFKVIVLYLYWIYTVYLFSNFDPRGNKKLLLFTLIICYCGIAYDIFYHQEFMKSNYFHFSFGESMDDRIRGFSLESSTLAITLVLITLLNILVINNKFCKIFLSATSIIFLIFIDSKAAIPILMISFFISYLKSFKIIIFILCCIFIGYYSYSEEIYNKLINPFEMDLLFSTSVATRVTSALSALLIMFTNPLGVGFTGYIPAFLGSIPDAKIYAEGILGVPLNFSEINGYLAQDSMVAVSAKSFFLENIIIWGFPFLYFWIKYNIKFLFILKNRIIMLIILFSFFALTTYASIINMYILAIAYGVILQSISSKQTYKIK